MKISPNQQEWCFRFQSMTLRQKIFWGIYFLYSVGFTEVFLYYCCFKNSEPFSLIYLFPILHCLLIWTLSLPLS